MRSEGGPCVSALFHVAGAEGTSFLGPGTGMAAERLPVETLLICHGKEKHYRAGSRC